MRIDYGGWLTEDLRELYDELLKQRDRLEDYSDTQEGIVSIPLIYHNEECKTPSVLLMPTFFEKIDGWNVEDSRKWIKDFMNTKVLPHRVSIQWKKGDIAVFNNRRFIHSSEPANNYIKNENSPERLLLQTFIPTTKPLKWIKLS